MAEKVNWSIRIQVENGPTISISEKLLPEVYDKIGVTLEEGSTGKEVGVLQGGDVQLLALKASKYKDPAGHSPKVKVGQGDSSPLILTAPLLLTGADLVNRLGFTTSPLFLDNPMSEPVDIDILVCRSATPAPV